MPSIPVWKRVDLSDKAMVKANGSFIKSEILVCKPELRISQKHSDSFVDLMIVTSEVHVSGPKLASPFPSLTKHSSMKFT